MQVPNPISPSELRIMTNAGWTEGTIYTGADDRNPLDGRFRTNRDVQEEEELTSRRSRPASAPLLHTNHTPIAPAARLGVSSTKQHRSQSLRYSQEESIKILKPLDLLPRLTCLRSAFLQVVR